jgi:hypothetical protein
MSLPRFKSLPLWLNLAILIGSAGPVRFVGVGSRSPLSSDVVRSIVLPQEAAASPQPTQRKLLSRQAILGLWPGLSC